MFDYLIVGAGFSGSVLAERIASQLNKKVLVVDKRTHIGGNAYDYHNEHDILIHKVQDYYDQVKVDIIHPANSEEMMVSQVGQELYNKFFKGYTLKQWDIHPKDLTPSVTGRIPVRTNRDDRYFTDKYQGVPKDGYPEMFKRMLNHPNISVMLQTDYREVIQELNFRKLIYAGSIDSYFDYKFGKLPYRSLRFEHETLDKEFYQPCQQINYPNAYDFTRIVEWKHATGQKSHLTTITREYSLAAERNAEGYYPIPRDDNHALYKKYREEAERLDNVIFCGRLAEYK